MQTAAVVLMSGCLCIRWLGVTANYVPAWAESRSGLMSGCLYIRWPGVTAVYVPAWADSHGGAKKSRHTGCDALSGMTAQ